MILRIIEPGLSPKLTGDFDGVDTGRRPPGLLIAGAMDRTVMRVAERDREFIARLTAQRAWLRKSEVAGQNAKHLYILANFVSILQKYIFYVY
jgi:hypothetical protein